VLKKLSSDNLSKLSSTEINQSKSSTTQITQQCEIHNKNIEVFCENDKSLLCVNCILDLSHKNHKLTAINKVKHSKIINILIKHITFIYQFNTYYLLLIKSFNYNRQPKKKRNVL